MQVSSFVHMTKLDYNELLNMSVLFFTGFLHFSVWNTTGFKGR